MTIDPQRGEDNSSWNEPVESGKHDEPLDNLWLARELYRLGAIRFGDFTVGRTTVNSPVYVDLRVLVGNPSTLRYAAELIRQETSAEQLLRRPRCDPYDVVAGVPYGGLHLATALSIQHNVPMVYVRRRTNSQVVRDAEEEISGAIHQVGNGTTVEGPFRENENVLVIDDLATTGGSLVETVHMLTEVGLRVRDAVVLVDRQQGAGERLRALGVRLHSILRLPIMLNLYMSSGMITEELFRRCVDYLESNRHRG